MGSREIPGLGEFLRDYPLMAVRPSPRNELVLKGKFTFTAKTIKYGELTDSFVLTFLIPQKFPKALPTIIETEGKIPHKEGFHVNPDGTLCLGSPLSLLSKLSKTPTLSGFTESCLIPYLFAISYKLQHGGALVFDELAHGVPGMLDDYTALFGLKYPEQAHSALKLLGLKKRIANKYPCPCGCGNRLGRCKFNQVLEEFRQLAQRSWFKQQIYR